MWNCDYDDCQRPAVRIVGECILCNRHLCSSHLLPDFHSCPPWEVGIVISLLLKTEEFCICKNRVYMFNLRTKIPTIPLRALPKSVSWLN